MRRLAIALVSGAALVAVSAVAGWDAPPTVTGTPTGSGWFSFWFNDDNNSFNGIWGNGKDTTPPAGRVVGQRSLGG